MDNTLFDAYPGVSMALLPDTPKFTIVAVTNDFVRTSGFSREFALGKGLFELFLQSPDDLDFTGERNVSASFAYVLSNKVRHQLAVQRYDIANGDGTFSERYWRINNAPVLDKAGAVRYIIHTSEDVTDQVKLGVVQSQHQALQKAYTRVRESEEKYRALFNSIDQGFCVIEMLFDSGNKPLDYRFLEINPAFEQQTGLKDAAGKWMRELVPYHDAHWFEIYGKIALTGGSIRFVERSESLGRWFDVYAYRIGGQEQRKVGIFFTDITQRKLTEMALVEKDKNLRSIIHHAPVAMLILRGEEMIVDTINERMLEIIHRTTAIINRPLLEVLPELKGQPGYESFLSVYREGKPVYGNEILVPLTRGEMLEDRYFNFAYTPIIENGKTVGVVDVAMEVTEQVKARKEIEEKSRDLQLAIEIADLGTFRVDLLHDSATYSKRVMDWFGFTEQGLSMSVISGRVHPEDRPLVIAALENSYTSEQTSRHDVTYRIVHPREGTVHYLRSFGKTEFNEQQRAYLMVGVIQDVTQQIKYQEHLEESEAELQKRVVEKTADLNSQKAFIQSILDASLDGVYALKAVRSAEGQIIDYRYLFANNQIATFLRKNVNEIIGASMLELLPENRSNGFFDLFCKLLQTGETFRNETHFVTRGIDSWFDFVIVPIDAETLVVSLEDVTEKKQSIKQIEEQRNLLDNILHNSSNGISVSRVFRDDNGNVIDALTILANDAAVKYIGLPKDVYLSKKATEIEPAIMGSPYYQACIKTLQTGEPFVMQYYMESTKRWLELTVSKLDDDHLIQIFTDVTSIKETQLQLERYVEELKRSNTNLEEFAYAASHDLKEPARKISFFADRLKQGLQEQMTDEQSRLFTRMQSASQRMGLLIDDLLTYSHVSRGASHLDQVDLNKKVQMVLEDLDLEIQEKGAMITVDKLPTITGNRRQLQQLFQNLIGNALKYSKPGVPPQIHITSKVIKGSETKLPPKLEDSNKRYYRIEVKDNGIGFNQEDAERIFNVFTRLHGNAEYKGSGVGLSIARKVVENHKGYIWAESSPGEGAAFNVLLPIE